MHFDHNNKIVRLCADAMMLEGGGQQEEAQQMFDLAWQSADTDFEKLVAAHYMARRYKLAADKLAWDQKALDLALTMDDDNAKPLYPSLYLNVGKCYEDMNDKDNALDHYQRGLSFAQFLAGDGYGQMILGGLKDGISRVSNASSLS